MIELTASDVLEIEQNRLRIGEHKRRVRDGEYCYCPRCVDSRNVGSNFVDRMRLAGFDSEAVSYGFPFTSDTATPRLFEFKIPTTAYRGKSFVGSNHMPGSSQALVCSIRMKTERADNYAAPTPLFSRNSIFQRVDPKVSWSRARWRDIGD